MPRISWTPDTVSPIRSESRRTKPHPLLGEGVHAALELRHDVELERVEGDRGGGHDPVLHQQEGEDDEGDSPPGRSGA